MSIGTNRERLEQNNLKLTELKAVADNLPDMPDLSNTTALASEILKGKTAYSQNRKITGTLSLNADQVVAGTEEIKRIYTAVPTETEISVESSDIQKLNTSGSGTQWSSFIDNNFPFMAFYNENDTISIYDKDRFFIQTLNYYTDSGNSTVSNYNNFMIQGFEQDNNYYFLCKTHTSGNGVVLYKYDQETELFVMVDNTYKEKSSMFYHIWHKDYKVLLPVTYNSVSDRFVPYVLYIENDEVKDIEMSTSNQCKVTTSSNEDKIVTYRDDIIFGPSEFYNGNFATGYWSNMYKIDPETYEILYSRTFDSGVHIFDYYNNFIALNPLDRSMLKIYRLSNNLAELTDTGVTITNSTFQDSRAIVRFLSEDRILVVTFNGNRATNVIWVYVWIYDIDYGSATATRVLTKSLQIASLSSDEYPIAYAKYGWVSDTTLAFISPSGRKNVFIDLSDIIIKYQYAEDNAGNIYFNYNSEISISGPEKVLENSGTFVYKDGVRTGTMPDNGALSYTPTTSQQTIPAGYTSGGTITGVTSSIDSNITPENIKNGVTILGVTGTYTGESE